MQVRRSDAGAFVSVTKTQETAGSGACSARRRVVPSGEEVAYKTSPTLLRELPGNFAVLDDESKAAMTLTVGKPGDVIAEGVEHGERWRISHDMAHLKYPDLPGS